MNKNDWIIKSYWQAVNQVMWLHPTCTVVVVNQCTVAWVRAGNSGGTREPSSQKKFGFAESFFDFEIFTELNSKKFLNLLPKLFLLHRLYQFLWHTHDFLFWNTITTLFLWTCPHHLKQFFAQLCVFDPIYSLFSQKFFSKTLKFPEIYKGTQGTQTRTCLCNTWVLP